MPTVEYNTNPTMFERFHIALTSERQGYTPWYFLLSKGLKDPIGGILWKQLKGRLSFEQALKKIKAGHNIGIAATGMDALCIVDVDDIEATPDKIVKPTLSTRSRKRIGMHYFYFTDDPRCKENLPTEDKGEIRSKFEYVVAPGSYVLCDNKTLAAMPETERELAGRYTVENERAPNTIEFEELPPVFLEQAKKNREVENEIKKNREAKAKERKEKKTSQGEDKNESAMWGLSIEDIMNIPNKIRFKSLFHESTTGKNTALNDNGGLTCWRHLVTHTPLSALAVLAGVTDCNSAGQGFDQGKSSSVDYSDGATVFKMWTFAKHEGILSQNDPIPAAVIRWYAVDVGICKPEDIIDGWKLPSGVYGQTLALIEKKENLSTGRQIVLKSLPTVKRNEVLNEKLPPIADEKESFSFTDYANARRIVEMYGENIRYCYTTKYWHVWNGKIWKQDAVGEIFQIAKKTIIAMYSIAATIEDTDKRKKIVNAIISCESQKKIKAMVESAENEPELLIDAEAMDNKKDFICVKNGIIDLKEGKLLPHTKKNYFTQFINYNYEKTDAPLFKEFLKKIMAGNQNLIGFLQRFLGYSLTGRTDEQVFCIFHGNGANGKGTLLDTILDIIEDFGTTVNGSTVFEKKYNNSTTNDIADLKGKRLIVTSENKSQQVLDEELVKELTGQSKIKCRFLFKEFFEYVPEFKLILVTNHEPIIKGQDYSIWRRILKVPFDVVIPKKNWDLDLRKKLLQEREGILNWLVEGAVDWYINGLNVPTEVEVSTEEYKSELDILGDFIAGCLIEDVNGKLPSKNLYEIYSAWTKITNNIKHASNSFSRLLNERGYKTIKSNNIRYKKGISIRPLLKDMLKEVWLIDHNDERIGTIGTILEHFLIVPLRDPLVNQLIKPHISYPIVPNQLNQQEIVQYINNELKTYTPDNYDTAVIMITNYIIKEYEMTTSQAEKYIKVVCEDMGLNVKI